MKNTEKPQNQVDMEIVQNQMRNAIGGSKSELDAQGVNGNGEAPEARSGRFSNKCIISVFYWLIQQWPEFQIDSDLLAWIWKSFSAFIGFMNNPSSLYSLFDAPAGMNYQRNGVLAKYTQVN